MNENQLAVIEQTISIPGVKVSCVGLEIDENLSQEQLAIVISCLHRVSGASNWMWGDALSFSGRKWGNRYTGSIYDEANKITGLAVPTLKAAKFTAEHIQPARRRKELTFTHHVEIAFGFNDPAVQDNWMDRAINEKWTAAQLRRSIRLEKKEIHEEPNKDAGKYGPCDALLTIVTWLRKEDPSKWSVDQLKAWIGDLQPIEEFRQKLLAIKNK